MIGLDTNVLVRYVMKDDASQAAQAVQVIRALTSDAPGFISLVTVVELFWVLRHTYRQTNADCLDIIDRLVDAPELEVQESALVRLGLTHARGGMDFADAVIAESGRLAGCEHTVTFDRRAARLDRMRLLQPDPAP